MFEGGIKALLDHLFGSRNSFINKQTNLTTRAWWILFCFTSQSPIQQPPHQHTYCMMRHLLWILNRTVQFQIFTSSWISLVRPFLCSEKHLGLNHTEFRINIQNTWSNLFWLQVWLLWIFGLHNSAYVALGWRGYCVKGKTVLLGSPL